MMFGLLQIYFLFNIYFILIKCDSIEDLSVRITDEKVIRKQRQETRDMCKIFNAEVPKASLQVEALPANKYDKRKKELKLKEKKEEIQNKRKHRIRRAVSGINSIDGEDENNVETNIDKINDDMPKKRQKTAYRANERPRATAKHPRAKTKQKAKGYNDAAKKSGRRFPFAPLILDGETTTVRIEPYVEDLPTIQKVRFGEAILPYFIDSKTYDNQLADMIIKAFDYFEKTTCIRLQRLRERPVDEKSLTDVLWLFITNPAGIRQCVHSNEKAEIQGVQMITFGYDCMSQGDIAHEIMHVLGFAHEHVRPDRDQYITILWDNIKPGYKQYFEVHNDSIVENLPYDYASVLHYPPRAFSRNGKVTIMTEHGIKIGQREGLSEMDVEKVGILYSNQCVKRNREYLLKTCPSAKRSEAEPTPVTESEIEEYFADRLWPYGVVPYKFKLPVEFSTEEIDNINAVIKHIQKETCLQFQEIPDGRIQDIMEDEDGSSSEQQSDSSEKDESSSSSLNFNTEELERLVILPVSGENYTKGHFLWQNSSSDESNSPITPVDDKIETKIDADDNKFLFDFNTGRKGKDNSGGKGSSVKGNNTNNSVKGEANIGSKGNYTNVGANGEDINIDNKLKPTNVTFRKAAGVRRKRAVPATPTRRHDTKILVLARSSKPGCQCPQGPQSGIYNITINTDCFNTVNDLLHVFVHVLGLDHQHNMHDRDLYLHIEWTNITEEVRNELQKLPPVAALGLPYDYQSVMHYPWLEIKNGQSNIMYPIWNDGWAMGHWQGLSTTDVRKIQILYSKKCYERMQLATNTKKNKNKKEEDDANKKEDKDGKEGE